MHSNTVIPLQEQNKISVWHELDFYPEKKLLVTPCQFVDCLEFDVFVCYCVPLELNFTLTWIF